MLDDNAPLVTPIPATKSPTSPLEIMSMPTLIAFDPFFRNITACKPHTTNLVLIATATTMDVRNNTYSFPPVRLTYAPIIAKNKGAKIISNFLHIVQHARLF